MECQVPGRQRQYSPRQRVDAHRQRVRRVPCARQRRRRHLHRHPRERRILRPGVQRRVRAEGRDVVHRPDADRSGHVRLAICEPRRAEGSRGCVPGCGAVGREVLLLGQVVLAPRPGDEAMRRRWMRGLAGLGNGESDQHGGSLSRQLSVQPNDFELGRRQG